MYVCMYIYIYTHIHVCIIIYTLYIRTYLSMFMICHNSIVYSRLIHLVSYYRPHVLYRHKIVLFWVTSIMFHKPEEFGHGWG